MANQLLKPVSLRRQRFKVQLQSTGEEQLPTWTEITRGLAAATG